MVRWEGLGRILLVLCADLASGPLLAQTTSTGTATETVMVTAEKRPEPVAEVSMSITTATGDDLAALGISSAGDLQKIVPDFTYTPSPYGAPIFSIRGIGFFDEAVGAAPTVSVYVDQVPLPFSRMTRGAALDLDRVEVLKGPQGTLFGQNSTGGAINFIPAKPTDTLQSGARFTAGRFAEADAEAFVSGPLAPTLTARFAVRVERSGDWQQSVSRNQSSGARELTNSRLLVDFHPNNALSLELTASGWGDRSDAQAAQFLAYSPTTPPQQGGFSGSPSQPNLAAALQGLPPPAHNDRAADWDAGTSLRRDEHFQALSLRGNLVLGGNMTMTAISVYSALRLTDPSDDDGTQYVDLFQTVEGRIRSFSQELRLAGYSGSTHWTLGANYQHDSTHDVEHAHNEGTNSGLFQGTPLEYRYYTLANLSDQRVVTAAVFGGADHQLTDTLAAQVSARYTDTGRTFDGCMLDGGDGQFGRGFGLLSNVLNGMDSFPSPADPGYVGPGGCATLDPATNRPLTDVHDVTHERNVSWRGGLAWKARPTLLLYANATQGFKSGNFGTLPLVYPTQAESVPAERMIAYEAGFKTALLEQTVTLAGAAYYYDYHHKQLLGYINTGEVFGDLPGEVSIPRSRVVGGELSATFRPVTSLTVGIGASRLTSKVTSDYLVSRPVSTAPALVDIKGEQFPDTPRWNMVFDADYTHAVTASWNSFVGVTVNGRGSTYSTFAPTRDFNIAGYALLDLRAGFARGDNRLRIEFWGHNVTDRYYWTDVARIQDTIFRTAGMPASYGLTIAARF